MKYFPVFALVALTTIFSTLPGKHYEVETKESIEAPWQRIGLSTHGTGAQAALVDSHPLVAHRYYRVVLTN